MQAQPGREEGVETSGARNMQNTEIGCGFLRAVHHSFARRYNSGSPLRYQGIESLINYRRGSDYRLAMAGVGAPSLFKQIATHHVTTHNTPIHNILSTAPQLSISQKALETLLEDGNVMPKRVGATMHD
jgi:hypothetical protein